MSLADRCESGHRVDKLDVQAVDPLGPDAPAAHSQRAPEYPPELIWGQPYGVAVVIDGVVSRGIFAVLLGEELESDRVTRLDHGPQILLRVADIGLK
jgi:hypothetical protein